MKKHAPPKPTSRRKRRPATTTTPKLTRGGILARDWAQQSTADINLQIGLLGFEANGREGEILRLQTALKIEQKALRYNRIDIEALEGVVESRR